MSVYFVTGRLGAGKTLCAVDKIREYLSAGRRVATNLDLNLEHLMPADSRATVVRIPDRPRVEDLNGLGQGCEEGGHSEERFGLLVLDECLTWLNSRSWNDKGRLQVLDWFLHARKLRWDIIFLLQNIEAVDGQLRDSLCEHFVQCRRLDKLKLFKVIQLPRIHHATVYYGTNASNGVYVDRWVYRGSDLFEAYDTEQRFKDGVEFLPQGPTDMRASYTHLSAWHLKGRYLEQPKVSDPVTIASAFKLLVFPLVVLWMLIHPRSCKLVAFKPGTFDLRSDRRKLLDAALDHSTYPPLS